jgi:hypothetical protein
MEIHAPHEPVRSLRDFLYHMLTVVLGILIALALEGLVEWNHHRHVVNETKESLASEIRINQTRLSVGLALAPKAEQRLHAVIQLAETRQTSHNAPSVPLDLSFGIFPLNSTSWTTAQFSGALPLMDPPDVQKYARLYTVQEHFLSVQDDTLTHWLALQKWAPFLNSGKGINAFSDQDVNEFKKDAATALIYLQTEESIAKTLNDEYKKTENSP